MGIIQDSGKLIRLKVELAAIIDIGEPFVKACYYLEGDGPLVLDCYETVDKLLGTIRVDHMLNVIAIVQSLIGKPLSDPQSVRLINYAKSYVKPGLDYFKRQLSTNMKNSLQSCRLFLLP